jgi:hypothetical protein
MAMEKGVKMRYVTEKPTRKNPLPEALKRLNKHPNFSLRYLSVPIKTPVVIEEGKRAVIAASSSSDFIGAPQFYSTNPHLITIAKEYFESIYREATPLPKKTESKSAATH